MNRTFNYDLFLEIEKKYNLYEDTIEGINYWTYARFDIWHGVIVKQANNLGTSHNVPLKSLKWKIDTLKGLIIKTIFRRRPVSFKSGAVCFVAHPRRIFLDGVYECIYTDKIAIEFPQSVTIEFPGQMRHMEPAFTKDIIYADYILMKKMFLLRWYKIFAKGKYSELRGEIRRKIEEPLNEIQRAYNIKLDQEKIITIIAEKIIYYKASINSINKIIGLLKPRVLLEVISYEIDCMIINEVCKRKGIPTIELQHGTLMDHLAYSYLTDRKVEQLPDKIFIYSDFWKQSINWPIEDDCIITTGFPYFERKLLEAKSIVEYEDKINILFISQGTIGKKLSELAVQLSNIMDISKYRIIYKLHPGEFAIWKEAYPDLKKDSIVVVTDNKKSIYDWFKTCKIQIGVHSTAIYEGLGCGLDTYIYQIEMSEQMMRLHEEGYIRYVKNSEQLYQYIKTSSLINKQHGHFWKENSMENVINNIKELLGE